MFESLEERAEVQGYRAFFGIIGVIFGLALPPMLYTNYGWFNMGIFLGLLTGASLFIALLGSEERGFYKVEEPLPVLEALKSTFRNRPFVIFVFTNLMLQYTVLLSEQLLPLYVQFVLGADQEATSLIFLVLLLTMFPRIVFWKWFVLRYGPKETAFIGLLGMALIIPGYMFIDSLTEALILAALFGFLVASPMYVFYILIADTIDYDEVMTGRRREGAYFGTNALIIRLATVLVSATVFLLRPFGYIEGAEVQPASAILGIKILFSLFSAVGVLIAALTISRFPIGKKERGTVQKAEEIHRKKLGELS